MRLVNRSYRLPLDPRGPRLDALIAAFKDRREPGVYPLRFSIVGVRDDVAELEATVVEFVASERYADRLEENELLRPRRKRLQRSPFCAVQIVPTGIRCELGGYAGDACPATNLLAAAVDRLVTHPNAVNASDLNEMAPNVLYVEGRSLDDFLLGHVGLAPSVANKIGTFLDPTGREHFGEVMNVLNAGRSAAGIDCGLHTVLDEDLGVRVEWSGRGCAAGTIQRPEVLIAGVERLLEAGADAIGGLSVIHGTTREMYQRHLEGAIPNPSGGVEAILTHLISKLFRVPTAHAPLPYYRDLEPGRPADPRAAAEFISTPHYFCVLKGLQRAPRLVPVEPPEVVAPDVIGLDHVGAVVVPASALGGIPALAADYSGIPLIAVRENHTILDVTADALGLENVIQVESYLEAAGVLLALRRGISLESLRRPIARPASVEDP